MLKRIHAAPSPAEPRRSAALKTAGVSCPFGGGILAPQHSPLLILSAEGNLTRRVSRNGAAPAGRRYVIDDQVGFLFRQAIQRNTAIFTGRMIEALTPTQFCALARLYEVGPCSQNRLGRLTAMDAATIKGVIDRLTRREFTEVRPDPKDARLLMVRLTRKGRETAKLAMEQGFRITAETLGPLNRAEQAALLRLLRKLC